MSNVSDDQLLVLLASVDPAADAHPSAGLRTQALASRSGKRFSTVLASVVSVVTAFVALCLGVFFVAAPNSASPGVTGQVMSEPNMVAPVSPEMQKDMVDGGSVVSGSSEVGQSLASERVADGGVSSGRALVRSGVMTVETGDVIVARDGFVRSVAGVDGYVSSEVTVMKGRSAAPVPYAEFSSVYPPSVFSYEEYVSVSAVVPAADLDRLVSEARSAGVVVSSSMSASDVSNALVDVDARIRSLSASLVTLNRLLSAAKSLDDVVSLEAAVSERNAQLDSLKAQKRSLSSQVAFSSLSVTFADPDSFVEASGPVVSKDYGSVVGWVFLGGLLVVSVFSGVYAYTRGR